MSDLQLSAQDIAAALRTRLDKYTPTVSSQQVGYVIEVGDGIARVSGLPGWDPLESTCRHASLSIL